MKKKDKRKKNIFFNTLTDHWLGRALFAASLEATKTKKKKRKKQEKNTICLEKQQQEFGVD